jgi:hypothetical protein
MDKVQKNEIVSVKILGARIFSQQIRRFLWTVIDYTADKTLYSGSCRYFQTLWKVQLIFTQ